MMLTSKSLTAFFLALIVIIKPLISMQDGGNYAYALDHIDWMQQEPHTEPKTEPRKGMCQRERTSAHDEREERNEHCSRTLFENDNDVEPIHIELEEQLYRTSLEEDASREQHEQHECFAYALCMKQQREAFEKLRKTKHLFYSANNAFSMHSVAPLNPQSPIIIHRKYNGPTLVTPFCAPYWVGRLECKLRRISGYTPDLNQEALNELLSDWITKTTMREPHHLVCSSLYHDDLATLCNTLGNHIMVLELDWCHITAETLTLMQRTLPHLRCLIIKGSINDDTITKKFPHLRVLHLENNYHLTDEMVATIVKDGSNLRDISFSGCPEVTCESIEALFNSCPYLSRLDLSRCTGITGLNFCNIKISPLFLRELNLTEVTDLTLWHLTTIKDTFPSLSVLTVSERVDTRRELHNFIKFSAQRHLTVKVI